MLEAAIERLEREGEAGIRVREIAAAAGVSYASLYHFFGDRDGLIEAAQAESYRRSLSSGMEIFRQAAGTAGSRDEFAAIVEQVLRVLFGPEGARRRARRQEVEGSAAFRPRLKQLLADAVAESAAAVAEVFHRAQQRGWVQPDVDPSALGVWLVGVVASRTLVESDPVRYDAAAWDDLVVRVVLSLLAV